MKRFSFLIVVLLLILTSFTAAAQYERGDVDQDGRVTIADVACLIDDLLNGNSGNELADVDQDSRVTIADVACLIDYLIKGYWEDEPVTPPDEHEWVDLGLPSGTLWATCNVGAENPEDYGDYFNWGETAPKEVYSWSTYKWCNGSVYALTKYCTNSYYGDNGFTDGKTELEPEDDAATANWGSGARMPSVEQIQELNNQCSWQRTQQNGVYGQLGTGPNGNTIFLPAAGYRCVSSVIRAGSSGFCWSRTLVSNYYSYQAHYMTFGWGNVSWDNTSRDFGLTVRAVRVP